MSIPPSTPYCDKTAVVSFGPLSIPKVPRQERLVEHETAMRESQSRRLAAILSADIAGYSALMGSDEARTVSDLRG